MATATYGLVYGPTYGGGVLYPAGGVVLPGNLFPVADSDFEVPLTGNWSNGTNCSLSKSSAQQFTGASSLRAAATSTGTLTFSYAAIPVTAGLGYTHSWWAYATSAGINAQMSVVYKNSGGAQVGSTVTLTNYSLANGSWIPAANHLLPPATAVTATFTMTVTGASASQGTYFDLFYTAQTVCQVLVALTSPPLSTSPQFADMTPWVRADQGISYNHGRTDEVSTVQPGTGTWTADNQLGWFAPGNAGSPFPFAVGQRTRFNFADETGAFHTRYDGYITDDPVTWQGGPALESMVTFTCQDLMAWLARENQLRTMLEEEMLYDQPQCLYTLADPSGSVTAADSSGNAAPPMVKRKYGSGTPSKVTFGSSTPVVGPIGGVFGLTSSPLTSALFSNDGNSGNTQLEAPLASPVSASAGFSFEVWFADTGTDVAMAPAGVAHTGTGASLSVLMDQVTATARLVYLPGRAGTPSLSSTVAIAQGSTFIVTVSGTTATLYYDGVAGPTLTIPAAFTANYLTAGGVIGGGAQGAGDYNGNLNCVVVYPSALSSSRIASHASAGLNDNWGGSSSSPTITQLVSNILRYAGVPSSFIASMPAGVSYPDAFEVQGQTPLGMIQLYQQVDGGVFYCAANGQLVWQDRAARYAAQVTPALTLQAGQYEEGLTATASTQYMVNDATYGNNAIPGGVRVANAAAVLANGTYSSGTPGSPLTGPWYSYATSFTNTPCPDVLSDAASWATNIYGTPAPRSPAVVIDLATQPSSEFSIATAYGAEVGSVIELPALPPSGPGGTRVGYLMVEGVAESFKRDDQGVEWLLSFNTSPASQSAAWIAGDVNMGVLGATAVVGRGTDGATNSFGVQYTGPPYPVPAFSTSMNRTGSVGANDMRGLSYNTQLAVTPPIFGAQQGAAAQSISDSAVTDIIWPAVWYDTANGFGPSGDQVSWTVLVAGVYEFMASVTFGASATGDRRCYFRQNGAEVAGRASIQAIASADVVSLSIYATVVCSVGDTIKVTVYQTSGANLPVSSSTFTGVWSGN